MVALWILFTTALWATKLEPIYLKSLASAKTKTEITRLTREYSRLKVLRIACEIQLRERRVPASCYEAVGSKERIRRLDRLCASAAANLRFSGDISRVSPACARNIRSAREIQNYRDEEREPWSEY